MHILARRFGPVRRLGIAAGLEPFQQDAVERLEVMLAQRGGAVLADSVGLGKTHVAVALIRSALREERAVTVVAPAPLRSHWERHLGGTAGWRWRSHTALSRAGAHARDSSISGRSRTGAHARDSSVAGPSYTGARAKGSSDAGGTPAARLIVVDEAHGFRNPATRRYRALAGLCEHAHVLLLTATPANNAVYDFYHLIRLFAPRDAFTDVDVPDLLAAFDAAARGEDTRALRRIAEAVMVRRTRRIVLKTFAGASAGAPRLSFPRREPLRRIRYRFAPTDPQLPARLCAHVRALTFSAHSCGRADTAATELLRMSLLKRLESSAAALRGSVLRHARLLDQFIRAAAAGLLFDVQTDAGLARAIDGSVQLQLERLTLRPWPSSVDRAEAVGRAREDLQQLHALASLSASELPDAKLARLRELLDGELAGQKVVIFTEFRDTAVMLWRTLLPRGGIALLHGSDARLGAACASRRTVLERFAPLACGARTPPRRERVRLLIATDVLAEGLNLQDAGAVISYDLPWNPIRLEQRIGRVDRLGSPHDVVRAYTFVPDDSLEVVLGLLRRIRRKLRQIRHVGGDAPWSLARRSPTAHGPEHVVLPGDAAGWELMEELRARYRERARTASAGARSGVPRTMRPSNHGERLRQQPTLVSRLNQDRPDRAFLCCFERPAGSSCVIVAERHPARMDGEEADRVLLHALSCGDRAKPDPTALRSAARRARRLVRPTAQPPPVEKTVRKTARALLRWLTGRPGGPAPDEADRAERVLAWLQHQTSPAAVARLDALLSAGAGGDRLVDQLAHWAAASSHAAHGAPPVAPKQAAPALIAALEIVPVPARKEAGMTPRAVPETPAAEVDRPPAAG